ECRRVARAQPAGRRGAARGPCALAGMAASGGPFWRKAIFGEPVRQIDHPRQLTVCSRFTPSPLVAKGQLLLAPRSAGGKAMPSETLGNFRTWRRRSAGDRIVTHADVMGVYSTLREDRS